MERSRDARESSRQPASIDGCDRCRTLALQAVTPVSASRSQCWLRSSQRCWRHCSRCTSRVAASAYAAAARHHRRRRFCWRVPSHSGARPAPTRHWRSEDDDARDAGRPAIVKDLTVESSPRATYTVRPLEDLSHSPRRSLALLLGPGCGKTMLLSGPEASSSRPQAASLMVPPKSQHSPGSVDAVPPARARSRVPVIQPRAQPSPR